MRRLASITLLAMFTLGGCKAKETVTTATSGSASATSSASAKTIAAKTGERWGGRIEIVGGAPLEFEVRFKPGDPPKAKIAIPAQQLGPTELVDVTYDAETIAFTLVLPGMTKEGQAKFRVERLPKEPDKAKGTLHQNGAVMPVRMKLLAEGEEIGVAARPQTPKPPFPYASREATFESKDGTKLAGTLTVPKGEGKHPAVLLISGTGEQNRDAEIAGHKFFLVLADHLTREGIAVLRVDDRGVGGSGGNTAQTGLDPKVEDALSGVAWLAAQPDVDPERIGLVGHSEGGLIAPLAAPKVGVKARPIAFIVLLAGPGVPGPELLRTQMELKLRAQGADPERTKIGMDAQNKLIDAVLAGKGDAVLKEIIVAQIDALLARMPEPERKKLGDAGRKSMIDTTILQVVNPAMRSFIRSNPGPTLEKVRCPVLALGGALDLQVPPDANLAAIASALARGKNLDVTTEALPGLNHLFQPAKLGTMEEWGLLEITLDPSVLVKVSTWLKKRAALP